MLRYADGTVDIDRVLASLDERKWSRGPVINAMHELLKIYNGEVAVPLPEMNASDRSLVANLVVQSVDAMGQRIASLMPTPEFPALRHGRVAEKQALDRASVVRSWWDHNAMRSKLQRRGRHYVGHGATGMVIRPDVKVSAPMWQLKSPLEMYPAETINPDDITPSDVIFNYTRSYAWLRSNYPMAAMEFHIDRVTTPKTDIEIIEYVDCHATVTIARNIAEPSWGGAAPTRKVALLEEARYDYGGLLPATAVGRVVLGGKIMGQFDQMVPMYEMQAKIAAMEIAAIQKGIWPTEWFVGSNGNEPTIISWPDPFTGKPGFVTDGQLTQTQLNPTYLAGQAQERLEYAQRMTGRVLAEQGGQGATNVRTGKRGDQIISQTVDLPIQEAQDDLTRALEHENKVAIAVQKFHFGRKTFSFYVNGDKMKGKGEYVPKDLFVSDDHKVSYPYSGADVNMLSINLMQLDGARLQSKDTTRKMHPLINDPEHEKDQIIIEGLYEAVLSGIQARVASPDPAQALPVGDVVALIKLIESDKKELPEAWEQIQKAAQERQAAQVPQGDPMAMPGAEMAGAGAEMSTMPEPEPGMDNLSAIFNRMRRPAAPRPMAEAG